MDRGPTLTARAIAPVLSGLRNLGFDPAPFLERLPSGAAAIHHPDARLPMSVMLALFRHAAASLDDQNLPLHLAERADLSSFDVHFYVMASSPTLGAALACLPRYQRLLHETSRVEVRPDSAQLLVRHLLPGGAAVPRESAEFVLASWVRAGRAVTGVAWRPVEVRFAHHPTAAAAGELERFFGCPIHFSTGTNALVVAAATAALPTLRADAGLLRILDRHINDLLERVPRSSSVADRIRHLLHGTLRTGVPTTAQLATRLHISPRTLERALRAEGTSYKVVLNGLRMELASEHLLTGTRSIGEIAFLLGFSEASAFHRAFRRWSGSTPAAFRSRVLAQPVSA